MAAAAAVAATEAEAEVEVAATSGRAGNENLSNFKIHIPDL